MWPDSFLPHFQQNLWFFIFISLLGYSFIQQGLIRCAFGSGTALGSQKEQGRCLLARSFESKTSFKQHFKYEEVQNRSPGDQNKDYFLPNAAPLSISLVSPNQGVYLLPGPHMSHTRNGFPENLMQMLRRFIENNRIPHSRKRNCVFY